MIKVMQFVTLPIFILSVLFYLLVAFAWNDGKVTAFEMVMGWQEKEEEGDEE